MSQPTAAQVRNYFRADAARMSALSAAAQHTVAEGARGRIHAEAVKAFNVKRRKTARYATGNTGAAKALKAEQREALRTAGVKVGKAGPLSAEARKALRNLK